MLIVLLLTIFSLIFAFILRIRTIVFFRTVVQCTSIWWGFFFWLKYFQNIKLNKVLNIKKNHEEISEKHTNCMKYEWLQILSLWNFICMNKMKLLYKSLCWKVSWDMYFLCDYFLLTAEVKNLVGNLASILWSPSIGDLSLCKSRHLNFNPVLINLKLTIVLIWVSDIFH